MSSTLGEKLRAAREEKGISVSEVAEQTRISPLYIESIENDDYRPLPGGIFNKGFVKSYARFVGFDEQEALDDYARIAVENEAAKEHPLKVYKPEVLTDDSSSRSMLPTIVFAGIILALMTGGVLFVVNYLQNRQTTSENTNSNTVANAVNANTANSANASPTQTTVPVMGQVKIEFKALTQPIQLSATNDGVNSASFVAAGSSSLFEPRESLTLKYSRWNPQAAQLTINGKVIALPSQPLTPKSPRIEFTISNDNLAQIWTTGAISAEVPPTDANANAVPSPAGTPVPAPTRPVATPAPRPSVTPTTPAKTPAPTPTTGATTTPRPTPRPTQSPN